MHQVTVYKYRVRGPAPQSVIDEIHRAHDLRNKLVETEAAYGQEVAQVWSDHPEMSAADENVTAAAAAVEELTQAAKDERKRNRTTRVNAETSAKLKQARARLKEAKATLKALKTRLYPEMAPRFHEADVTRRAGIKALYRESVDGGLYWASYNEAVDRLNTTRKLITKRRKQGQPAELRFHRWTGEGTIRVQLQRQASDPPRTPELLASGEGKWRNVFQLTPWVPPHTWNTWTRSERRKWARTGRVRFRLGSGEYTTVVELPVVIHRPLPPEADITDARLTRRRTETGAYEFSLAVTARIPAPAPRTEGSRIAVHLGWRVLDDGAIRVATIIGAPGPPEHINGALNKRAGLAVRHHQTWSEVVIPASWRQQITRAESIASIRATNLNVIKTRLAEDLAEASQTMREAIDPDNSHHLWRSPERFARLATELRGAVPAGAETIAAYLEAWRAQDAHLRELHAGIRRQILGARTETWKRVAAWLTSTDAAAVFLDDWNISDVARRPGPTTEDTEQERHARANRTLAAPGILRTQITVAAQKRGVTVHTPKVTDAATHYGCGGQLDPDERVIQLSVFCRGCDRTVDQDINTARHLYNAPLPI